MLTSFHFALSFLTTLPFPLRRQVDAEEIGHSLAWFPLVGLVIGLCLAAAWNLLQPLLPRPVVMVLVLGIHILLSGGFHLDGVADSADGWFSGRGRREEILDIMRDSAIGTMGTLALILLLLLKFTALESLPAAATGSALLLMPVYGRFTIVVLAYLSPYARPEGGLGKAIVTGAGRRELLLAGGSTAIMALAAAGSPGLLLMLLLAAAAGLISWRCRRRLGGITGDLLGFACEAGEVLALLGWLLLNGR